jgi:hypothetical protein
MREINVGPASTFADPGRKLIESDGVEVGVFKLGGEFFAYENVCPHMGGPACQGKTWSVHGTDLSSTSAPGVITATRATGSSRSRCGSKGWT